MLSSSLMATAEFWATVSASGVGDGVGVGSGVFVGRGVAVDATSIAGTAVSFVVFWQADRVNKMAGIIKNKGNNFRIKHLVLARYFPVLTDS